MLIQSPQKAHISWLCFQRFELHVCVSVENTTCEAGVYIDISSNSFHVLSPLIQRL